MKYFTPLLFEKMNSSDFDMALAATAEWDDAGRNYLGSLASWITSAPAGVRKLARKFCGHDAVFTQAWSGESLYCLFVATEWDIWMLSYQILSAPVITRRTSSANCWSDEANRLWLYDEVSRIAEGHFRHEILASDGSTFQIDFSDVQLKSAPINMHSSRRQKFDLKMELSVTTQDLKAAFRHASLIPHKPATTTPKRKSSKKSKSSKAIAKQSLK